MENKDQKITWALLAGCVVAVCCTAAELGGYSTVPQGNEEPAEYRLEEPASLSGVTNLIMAIRGTASGAVEIELQWPDAFANDVEIYATTNLMVHPWQIAKAAFSTVGSTHLLWTDGDSLHLPNRFYIACDAELDRDADGLADGREHYLYGTASDDPDSDQDGVSDGAEALGLPPTNPLDSDVQAPVVIMTSPVKNRVEMP